MIDAIQEIDRLTETREINLKRRSVLQGAAIGTAAMAAGSAGLMGSARAAPSQQGDYDILNFALNLEYLEAEYYLRGTIGQSLTAAQTSGTGGQGIVTAPSTTLVPFVSPSLAYYFIGIAADENAHVNVLRQVLGNQAVAEPNIDLLNSFNALWVAAGLGSSFNPFANETNFLIGAYVFEDVGVTAYAGAANMLQTGPNGYLPSAAKILAVEGFHAGAIRGFLSEIGGGLVTNAISKVRQTVSGITDKGTDADSNPFNITNVDDDGTAFTRTATQVLNVVYGTPGTGVTRGLFFPTGMNGNITIT